MDEGVLAAVYPVDGLMHARRVALRGASMKARSLLIAVCLGLFASPLTGQVAEGFPRSGRVADSETRLPLSGAIVELPELGIRMVSDALGRIDFGRLSCWRECRV